MSLIRLRRITFLAQHLQVVIRCMSALAPRNDVVTFHILKGVLGVDAICNAQGALVTLPLIGAKLLRFSKRTKGQVLFIAPSAVREDELDDTCLLGHIIVHHELLDVRFQSVAVVLLRMILVVEQSPCLCIRNSLPLRREQHFSPVDDRQEVKPEIIGIILLSTDVFMYFQALIRYKKYNFAFGILYLKL